MSHKIQVRFIVRGTTVYLRTEDVLAYLQELGGSEEPDVRKRIEEAAKKLGSIKPVTE